MGFLRKLFSRPEQYVVPDVHCDHYCLVHMILPLFVDHDRVMVMSAMSSSGDAAYGLLEKAFGAVNETRPIEESEQVVSLREVGIGVSDIGGHPMVMLAFPPPSKAGNAFMVGLVHTITDPDPRVSPVRYFTLEKQVDLSSILGIEDASGSGTMLCEWTFTDGKRSHSNYGVGCEPAPELFKQSIAAVLFPQPEQS